MNPPHDKYCANTGSKLINTMQNLSQNHVFFFFLQDDSGHNKMFWLYFSIAEESGDVSSIFFYSLCLAHLNIQLWNEIVDRFFFFFAVGGAT